MKRFEVWIVRLDPVRGSEIGKTRSGVIISPDEANDALRTVLIAPLTSVRRRWPTRLPVEVDDVAGAIALDQIRAVDKIRLSRKLKSLSDADAKALLDRLRRMFAF